MKKIFSVIHEEGLLLIGVSFLVGHSGSSLISSVINKVIMPYLGSHSTHLDLKVLKGTAMD